MPNPAAAGEDLAPEQTSEGWEGEDTGAPPPSVLLNRDISWQFGSVLQSISTVSREYVSVSVSAWVEQTGTVYEVQSCEVLMAFLPVRPVRPARYPRNEEWVAGAWEARPLGRFAAQVLVGAGGDVALSRGAYHVWLAVLPPDADTPEQPRQVVGQVTIT